MKQKTLKFEEKSPLEFRLLRDELGFKKRYYKWMKRNREERKILLELALRRIEEKEKDDFILLEPKKRKIKI